MPDLQSFNFRETLEWTVGSRPPFAFFFIFDLNFKLSLIKSFLFILFIGLLPFIESCNTCTKECAYCDGTGKTTVGPTKGMSCRACEGDGCWSDQSQPGN